MIFDVYYIERPETPPPRGIREVERISSPAGAMVQVEGSYTDIIRYVMWMYEECEPEDIINALPIHPLDLVLDVME